MFEPGSEGADFDQNLETLYRASVLDNLFTRKPLRELDEAIDQFKSGNLDQKYLIGYVSRDRAGQVAPKHVASGTLVDFISRDLSDLLKAKFGKEEGMKKYYALFGPFFEQTDHIVDENGVLNLAVAESLLGFLENTFSEIELTVFAPSMETTGKYIDRAKTLTRENIEK